MTSAEYLIRSLAEHQRIRDYFEQEVVKAERALWFSKKALSGAYVEIESLADQLRALGYEVQQDQAGDYTSVRLLP